MRLLFVAPQCPSPLDNGLKTHWDWILRHLARAGWDLELIGFAISPAEGAAWPGYARSLGARLVAVIDHARGADLAKRQLGCLLGGEPLARARFPHAALEAELDRVFRLRSDAPGVLVFGQYNILPTRRYGVPTLLLPVDSYPLYYGRLAARAASPFEWLRNRYLQRAFARFEQRWYPQYDCVAPVSDPDARAIAENVPAARVERLPVALPESVAVSRQTAQRPRVLIAGVYSMPAVRRDAIRFLGAWRSARRPDCELIVWGRGARRLDAQARAAGAQTVEWVDDYAQFLASGQIYVYPQRSAAGVQTKLQQAIGAGLAAVAHPEMLSPMSLEDGVHALAGSTAEEMADQTARLAGLPHLRESVAQAGRGWIESRFCERAAGGALDRILASLLAAHPGSMKEKDLHENLHCC